MRSHVIVVFFALCEIGLGIPTSQSRFGIRDESVDIDAINANLTLPLDPDSEPDLTYDPFGRATVGPASHVFLLYYLFVDWAFLLDRDCYVETGQQVTHCFDLQSPSNICITVETNDLKLRASVVGWIALHYLSILTTTPSAPAPRWPAVSSLIKTNLGFEIARIFAFASGQDQRERGLEYTPKCSLSAPGLFEPPTQKRSDEQLEVGDTGRDRVDIYINFNGDLIAETSVIFQIFNFAHQVIWPEDIGGPVPIHPGSGWATDPMGDGVMLAIDLLDDKDPWRRPLVWGWIAIAMEALTWTLSHGGRWQVFEAEIRAKASKEPFLRVTSVKVERLADGSQPLSHEEFAKVPFKEMEVKVVDHITNSTGIGTYILAFENAQTS